ncbi:hypothetical protein C8Q76DRAFT_694901 [Earliella scabrosa]|nr:hypothetical protein C8Q76DRAFT_694901 [Earliella scabrosa]
MRSFTVIFSVRCSLSTSPLPKRCPDPHGYCCSQQRERRYCWPTTVNDRDGKLEPAAAPMIAPQSTRTASSAAAGVQRRVVPDAPPDSYHPDLQTAVDEARLQGKRVVVFPGLLRPTRATPTFFEDIATARSRRCRSCCDRGFPCKPSNLSTWLCLECILTDGRECSWFTYMHDLKKYPKTPPTRPYQEAIDLGLMALPQGLEWKRRGQPAAVYPTALYAAGERGESVVGDAESNNDVEQSRTRVKTQGKRKKAAKARKPKNSKGKQKSSSSNVFERGSDDEAEVYADVWDELDTSLKKIPVDVRLLGWALAIPLKSIHERLESLEARDDANKVLLHEFNGAMKAVNQRLDALVEGEEGSSSHLAEDVTASNDSESDDDEAEVDELVDDWVDELVDEDEDGPATKRTRPPHILVVVVCATVPEFAHYAQEEMRASKCDKVNKYGIFPIPTQVDLR